VKLKLFTIVGALLMLCFTGERNTKPLTILRQMYDSIAAVKTLRLKISALERVDRKFISASSEVKLQVKPRKLYYRNTESNVEVLYDSEISPRKALVQPNTFPYISLWLDPAGNIMRRNQHYTLHELGFEFIGKSVALTINKDKEGLDNFIYHGKYPKNGRNCYLIEYENNSYGYVSYVVGDKETASSIAYRLCVNDHLLRNANALLNDFGYLRKGRVLKVPNLYCKKAIIYIDDRLLLPVSISIYDEAGLFESYDYLSIETNISFQANEFSRNFRGYSF
jgi:hypothetical protein